MEERRGEEHLVQPAQHPDDCPAQSFRPTIDLEARNCVGQKEKNLSAFEPRKSFPGLVHYVPFRYAFERGIQGGPGRCVPAGGQSERNTQYFEKAFKNPGQAPVAKIFIKKEPAPWLKASMNFSQQMIQFDDVVQGSDGHHGVISLFEQDGFVQIDHSVIHASKIAMDQRIA